MSEAIARVSEAIARMSEGAFAGVRESDVRERVCVCACHRARMSGYFSAKTE